MICVGTSGACRARAWAMISRSVPSSTAPRSLSPMGSDQLVERGAFGLTSGDPHHGAEGAQRGIGGVGLVAVIHPGDPMAFQHGLDLVRANRDRLQSFADRRRRARRTSEASAAAASALATLCGAAGLTSLTLASSSAESRRCSMKARSTSRSSTTPSIDNPGVPSVKPIARAPSTTSACSTICSVTGSATL